MSVSSRPLNALIALKALGLICILLSVGCGPSVSPEVTKLRDGLMLNEAPEEVLAIIEAKEKVKETPSEVAVMAEVTSGDHAVWEEGRAVFAISEILEEDSSHGGEGHDPSTCPFCKRRQAALEDTRAMVQIVDEQGNVIDMDARKLLGIKEKQQLIVRGQGELDQLGNLVVSANGVYIK